MSEASTQTWEQAADDVVCELFQRSAATKYFGRGEPAILQRLAAQIHGFSHWVYSHTEYDQIVADDYYELMRIALAGLHTESLVTGNDPHWAKDTMRDIASLAARKHGDYGPNNINAFGHIGIAVRLNDKLCRLQNLMANDTQPNYEGIADTWTDIIGYALVGVMLLEGTFNLGLANG